MPITVDDLLEAPLLRRRVQKRNAEARAEGEAVGEARGKVQGMAELLLHVLESRFGHIPARTRNRVLSATPDRLLTWSTRALDADSLDTILRTR